MFNYIIIVKENVIYNISLWSHVNILFLTDIPVIKIIGFLLKVLDTNVKGKKKSVDFIIKKTPMIGVVNSLYTWTQWMNQGQE